MTNTGIGRRYAGAVFNLGVREGGDVISKRGQALAALDALLDESPALANVFRSPVFTVDEKKRVIADVLKKVDCDAVTRSFLHLLADNERLPQFRDIVREYGRLLDAANNVVRGTVTTAVPLTKEKRKSVRDELEAKAGKTLELAFEVDPAILGGVVLKMGGRILDSSLRAQLEILRDTLRRGR